MSSESQYCETWFYPDYQNFDTSEARVASSTFSPKEHHRWQPTVEEFLSSVKMVGEYLQNILLKAGIGFRDEYVRACQLLNILPHPSIAKRQKSNSHSQEDNIADRFVQNLSLETLTEDVLEVNSLRMDIPSFSVFLYLLGFLPRFHQPAFKTLRFVNNKLSVDHLHLLAVQSMSTSVSFSRALHFEWNPFKVVDSFYLHFCRNLNATTLPTEVRQAMWHDGGIALWRKLRKYESHIPVAGRGKAVFENANKVRQDRKLRWMDWLRLTEKWQLTSLNRHFLFALLDKESQFCVTLDNFVNCIKPFEDAEAAQGETPALLEQLSNPCQTNVPAPWYSYFADPFSTQIHPYASKSSSSNVSLPVIMESGFDLAAPLIGPHCMALSRLIGPFSALQHLSLRGCNLSVHDVRALAMALPSNGYLTNLVLSHNDLDDKSAFALAAGLLDNRNLQRLDLSDNKISNKGAAVLMSGIATRMPVPFNEMKYIQQLVKDNHTKAAAALKTVVNGFSGVGLTLPAHFVDGSKGNSSNSNNLNMNLSAKDSKMLSSWALTVSTLPDIERRVGQPLPWRSELWEMIAQDHLMEANDLDGTVITVLHRKNMFQKLILDRNMDITNIDLLVPRAKFCDEQVVVSLKGTPAATSTIATGSQNKFNDLFQKVLQNKHTNSTNEQQQQQQQQEGSGGVVSVVVGGKEKGKENQKEKDSSIGSMAFFTLLQQEHYAFLKQEQHCRLQFE